MSIYKSSVNKPITTILIFVGVIIMGLYSLIQLPIDQFPEIEIPSVTVMTSYPGANGTEVETNVSKILENSLNSVDGLKEVYSTSKDNLSLVTLEFEWGANLDEALNDVRSSIDLVYDALPDGASRPMIIKLNASMMPVMQYAVTAEDSYPGIKKIIEDNLITVLNRIDGIGNISLLGSPQRYVYVDIDPTKLNSFGLSLETVGSAIANNNMNLASGTVKMGKEQYQLRVQGEYVASEDINNIVVSSTYDGKQIFVRDVAQVRDTIKDVTLEEKINGKDGARLIIMKQSGANTVEIAKKVREQIAQVQKTLPPDVKFEIIYDSSDIIQNSVSGLSETIMYALIFVVFVVLLFLGKWRATFIISITIPISLIVSFIYLYYTGSSLNIISLSSLSIAIGMVVDDAIVVLENINIHIERGSSPREAAIYATNEVWVSVIATTLVIVAVFLPLTLVGGIAGVMFKELGWIVTIVVCVSTLVAITLTPSLSAMMLTIKKKTENSKTNRFSYQNTVVKWLDKIDAIYANIIRWCLRNKAITLTLAVLIFVGSLVPVFMGAIGTDFMPQNDEGRLTVTIELQRGTRLEEASKTARIIESRIAKIAPETQLISTSTGSSDETGFSSLFTSSTNNKIVMMVRTSKKYDRERTIFEIAEKIREDLATLPEVITYDVSTASFGGGMVGGNNVEVEIFGHDFDATNAVAAELKQRMEKLSGARNVDIDREEDRPELKIELDKEKISRHGINTVMMASYVRNRVNGMSAGNFKEQGDEYPILVRLTEEHRNSITSIEELNIATMQGKLLKLKELADIKEYWGPPNIERKRRERIVTVSATPEGVSLGELAEQIKAEVKQISVPQGVQVQVGGDYETQQESFAEIATLFLLIVILVYIVMASQFESFSKPFIIMMSVPFAITGVILALLITGTSLNLIGALGVVLLVGIVVKNGIVLVDYINLMRDRGNELNEAIALSGQSRLRPVLMTAVTTILGMIPMTLSTSEGSETWVPMGIVVIGGLVVSTLVTLIVVPTLYAVMSRRGERNKEEKLRKSFTFFDKPVSKE
ncbi:MAG: efflux RND transporter permease subunit [Paludibacteraceae bacterium]|nr:efflux RND transporter permease subunit [Paludibacteraceae bacterium]